MTEETKEPLIGKTLEELRTLARDLGMPAFVGGQIARWLYVQHVKDINEMANISKKHRELLAQRFTVGCHAPIDAQYSKDGTIKYLFPVYAGASKEKLRHEFVETVYIPDGDRATLTFERRLKHPVERVWAAITEPAHRDIWMGKTVIDGRAAPSAAASLAGGGAFCGVSFCSVSALGRICC